MKPGPLSRPVKDSALDREIEAALAVNPSPEFVSRIRSRIAKEPEPSAWTVMWNHSRTVQWVLFATVVIGVSLLGIAFPRLRQVTPLETVPSPQVSAMLPSVAEAELPTNIHTLPSRTPQIRMSSRTNMNEPEVLISAGETNAIRRLLNAPPIQWVELQTFSIEPKTLLETPVMSIPESEEFRSQPNMPATSKGDNQ